jgi:uncharacterized protein (TIGR00159 family)
MIEKLLTQLSRVFGDPQGYEILVLVADIVIVYYVIYRLLMLIQGTRALQMLIGLLFIVLGYFFSNFLGLVTLRWIISNFIFQVFLIIIVVFQNDIRRGLSRLGQSPFLAGSSNRDDFYILEEIIKAAGELASRRIGALIVIERSADVTDALGEEQQGTLIDAKVSRELLWAIFVPEKENPIHDGAVIVRQGRVYSAGAVLPLSQSTLERNLGTRHRAALGLSEQIDAAVLVVSEERGKISICVNGVLMKDLATDALRETLLGLFEPRWTRRKTQRPKGAPSTNAQAAELNQKPASPSQGNA